MVNDRLRDVLNRSGLGVDDLADHIGVDRKSVERWITQDRVPYPKNRHAIAALLRESEAYLWPTAVTERRGIELSGSEVVQVYPSRSAVPRDLWDRLLDQATNRVDVLVYVGMFLTENPNLLPALRAKGAAGGRIRLLFGDPASREVSRRSTDEGIGKNAISVKIRNALAFFARMANPGSISDATARRCTTRSTALTTR